MLLQSLGAEARVAYTGAEALSSIATFKPRVAFVDIGMPDMDGYDTGRAIRSAPNGQDIVLVALSGWGSDKDRERTLEAGFNCHFREADQLRDFGKHVCFGRLRWRGIRWAVSAGAACPPLGLRSQSSAYRRARHPEKRRRQFSEALRPARGFGHLTTPTSISASARSFASCVRKMITRACGNRECALPRHVPHLSGATDRRR